MELFKQYWNAVWHFEAPQDPGVLWFHDTFGDLPLMIGLIAVVMTGFALWCAYHEYVYIQRPKRKFDAQMRRFQETGDLSVFDE